MTDQNYINHIAFCLDASGSMASRSRDLIRVMDAQVKYLAQRSEELDQETRVSIYTFDTHVECVVYDKDVLRLPSIAQDYHPGGMTALIDATLKALDDLAQTPELYGEHSFLLFALTDGAENRSVNSSAALTKRLRELPDHWTVAVLTPDQVCKHEAKRFGFPADNIAIWDAVGSTGMVEVGETIRRATDNFMAGRTSGVRGSKSLFSMGADAVNRNTITQAKLMPLPSSLCVLVPVPRDCVIREFVQECGYEFKVGKQFYQLSKPEKIQATKQIAIVEKKTEAVFTGPNARHLLGLPDAEVRVKPESNPDYWIYVQSTSTNRKLVAGTKLMLLS